MVKKEPADHKHEDQFKGTGILMAVISTTTNHMKNKKLTERVIQGLIWEKFMASHRLLMPNFCPGLNGRWHECDVYGITKAGYAREFEIKLSVGDFKRDAKKRKHTKFLPFSGGMSKHEELAAGVSHGPSQFWFVVPQGVIDNEPIPSWAGLFEVVPSTRYINCWGLVERKSAPKLHRIKADTAIVVQAKNNCYYRYWGEVCK